MKKKYRKVLIIIISLILISFGIIIYLRYTKTKEIEKPIINNYYSSEFLFNNNYIKLAEKVEDSKNINKDLDIHKNGNKLYVNLLNQSTEISELPDNSNTYFSQLDNDCYEFASLKDKDLYYARACLTDKNQKKFEKISSTAKTIYVPDIYKKGIYVSDNPESNFIIDTTLKELKYISYEQNVLGLYNDISKTNPYFDYLCGSNNSKICKDLMIYVSFSNELYYKDKLIKTNDNKKLIVRDLFGILTVPKADRLTLNNLDYNTLQKYDYQFIVYILDKDNYLYEVVIDKNKRNNLTAVKKDNKKIKLIDYKKDKNSKVEKIIITNVNGTTTSFNNEKNQLINTSTIYERQSLVDTLKK